MTRQKISNYDLQFVAPITNNIEYIGVGISGTVWVNHKLFSDGSVDESPGSGITTGTTALGTQIVAARVDHTHNLPAAHAAISGADLTTFVNKTNITASVRLGAFFYQRIGDVVQMYGAVSIDPTAVGLIELGINLPFPSNFTVAFQCVGTGVSDLGDIAYITSDATNDRAQLNAVVASALNSSWYIHFSYRIL